METISHFTEEKMKVQKVGASPGYVVGQQQS